MTLLNVKSPVEYDLSLNRYKEVVHETVEHDSPKEVLTRLAKLEDEITKGRKELKGLLK
jgi:type I restriction enzyme M protein